MRADGFILESVPASLKRTRVPFGYRSVDDHLAREYPETSKGRYLWFIAKIPRAWYFGRAVPVVKFSSISQKSFFRGLFMRASTLTFAEEEEIHIMMLASVLALQFRLVRSGLQF